MISQLTLWVMVVAGERKTINHELWYACAGPLVALPPVGSLVVYFPQGHSEQVMRIEGVTANLPLDASFFLCCGCFSPR